MNWRFLRRKRNDAELLEEINVFLEEETAENIARGMSPEEARRQARVKLGNAERVRETEWLQNTLSVEKLWRDLKYASRTLTRAPGFSLVAIAVMALCIGAATSLFTIVRSVLLRPLPFRDPGRLVMIYEHFRGAVFNQGGFNYNPVSPADFYDWRSQTQGFEDMAVWTGSEFDLTGDRGELPESVQAAGGSWNLFQVLGVQPALGRTFAESDDRSGQQRRPVDVEYLSAQVRWRCVDRGQADPSRRQALHNHRRPACGIHLPEHQGTVVGSVQGGGNTGHSDQARPSPESA